MKKNIIFAIFLTVICIMVIGATITLQSPADSYDASSDGLVNYTCYSNYTSPDFVQNITLYTNTTGSWVANQSLGLDLYDNFNDASINGSLWDNSTSAGSGCSASASESGGTIIASTSGASLDCSASSKIWQKTIPDLSSINYIKLEYVLTVGGATSNSGSSSTSSINILGIVTDSLTHTTSSPTVPSPKTYMVDLVRNSTDFAYYQNGTYQGQVTPSTNNITITSSTTIAGTHPSASSNSKMDYVYYSTDNITNVYNSTVNQTFQSSVNATTLWSCESCNSTGSCSFAPTNRTIYYSSTPTINLIYPPSNTNLTSQSVIFSGNVTSTGNLANVSLIMNGIYNETNSSGIQGIINFTKTMSEGTHNWTYEACDDTSCKNTTTQTLTINLPPTIGLLNPSNNTYTSTTSQNFQANITDTSGVENLTFFLWNSTGNQLTNYSIKQPFAYSGFAFTQSFGGICSTGGIVGYNNILYLASQGTGCEYVKRYYQNGTSITGTYYTNSFDNANTGNVNLRGITYLNGFFYILNINGLIYKYYPNNITNVGNFSFDASSNFSGSPVSIINDSNYLYLLDNYDYATIYNYSTDGTYNGAINLAPTEAIGDSFYGVTIYSGFFYLTDLSKELIYKIYINGTYTGISYDLSNYMSGQPGVLTIYNNSLWLEDFNYEQVYRFDLRSDLSNYQYNYSYSLSGDGNYTWNTYGCDSLGSCAFSSTGNQTIVIDTTKPQIDYGSGTQSNGASVEATTIFVNVTLTETNFKNITYNLYWSNDTLLNSTNYSTSTTSITFSGLSQGISYKYNVTTYDLVNQSNSTSTRTITLTAPAGGSTGGGATVGTGNWTMEVSKGIKSYDKILPTGVSIELPISFYNTGEKNQTITLSCKDINETFCKYVDLGNATFNLPLIKDLQTIRTFKITIPENVSSKKGVFNIIGTDLDKNINSISVTITTGKQGFFNTVASKVQLSSTRLFGIPYFLIFIIPLIGMLFLTTKFLPEKLFIRPLWIILISLGVPLVLIYFI